jgi:uncharacterized protein (DUF4415 family)
MEQAKTMNGLSPEQVERIKAAQKRHAAVDPGCEKLSPEEFINWHPVGGISWEERARRMKEAGIHDAEDIDVPIAPDIFQWFRAHSTNPEQQINAVLRAAMV